MRFFPCWNCWQNLAILIYVQAGYASGIRYCLNSGNLVVAGALAWNLTVITGAVNRMCGIR